MLRDEISHCVRNDKGEALLLVSGSGIYQIACSQPVLKLNKLARLLSRIAWAIRAHINLWVDSLDIELTMQVYDTCVRPLLT